MKKRSLRSYLLLLLIACSFASYIYINTVTVDVKPQCSKHLLMTPDKEVDKSETDLPEMQIVKKLLEKGKRLLPSTTL